VLTGLNGIARLYAPMSFGSTSPAFIVVSIGGKNPFNGYVLRCLIRLGTLGKSDRRPIVIIDFDLVSVSTVRKSPCRP